MKLTKDIKVKAYEVLADYKVKVKKSPFIAILKFANENGGKITSEQLYNDFLQPLSKKACENILERLVNMGYFEKEKSVFSFTGRLPENERDFHNQSLEWNYKLTVLGQHSAEQEEFYEERNGILKIFLADNEFIEQKIVKIEEVNRPDSFEEKDLRNISKTDLSELQNTKVVLESGTFIIENFKEKCRVFKSEQKQFILQTRDVDSLIKLMDFTTTISKTSKEVRNEILRNEFGNDFLEIEQLLKVNFNPKNLSLELNKPILKPKINKTTFNRVKLENIKLSPKNKKDAYKWFKALIIQKIYKYFLSETEFKEFTNKIAQEFELFDKELKNSISREDIIQELDNEKDFYKKAKLETINYLHY